MIITTVIIIIIIWFSLFLSSTLFATQYWLFASALEQYLSWFPADRQYYFFYSLVQFLMKNLRHVHRRVIFFSVYTHVDWETSQVFTSATFLQTSSSSCFSMKSVALVKKKNRWKKDLMLSRRAELWECSARKVETQTFHAPHSQSSTRCANINFFLFFLNYFLTCRTGLAEKQGLLIV